MEKNNTFTQGRILKPLILFALPVLLALFLQAMYGAVDLLIVGKFASSADVSAVSTGSQIMMTLTNLVSSFAMGTTVLLGQQIGFGGWTYDWDCDCDVCGDRSYYDGCAGDLCAAGKQYYECTGGSFWQNRILCADLWRRYAGDRGI